MGIPAWTIQPWNVWEQVAERQQLWVDWKYAANLHTSYDWLREQLSRRIPGYSGRYPWWAYDHRPDLRAHRHLHPQGEACVLLELDVPPERSAALPAWAWDAIFCGEYVTPSRRESLKWARRLREAVPDEDVWPPPEPWRSELYASWEQIFAPDFPRRGWRHRRRYLQGQVEIVFDVLERSMVRSVTKFVGTNKLKCQRSAYADEFPASGPSMYHRA